MPKLISALYKMIEILKYDPRVKYIELNGDIFENSEFVPVGITKSMGGSKLQDFSPKPDISTDCSDPESFRVGIVDGGIDVSHYDFEFCGVYEVNGQPDPNRPVHCMGRAFLGSSDEAEGQNWYNTGRDHGMHVAGIIAASAMNNAGLTGMIGDEKLCLVIARVFGGEYFQELSRGLLCSFHSHAICKDGGGATVAGVARAIIWAADNGAKVINMSLGTSSIYATVTSAIEYAYAKGL